MNKEITKIDKDIEKVWVLSLSDIESSKQRYLELIRECESLSYDKGRGRCLMGIGRILCFQHNIVESMEKLEEALTILMEKEDGLGTAYCYTYIGLNYSFLPTPNYKAAHEFLNRAFEIAQSINNVEAIQRIMSNIGEVHRVAGHFEDALKSFRECLAFSEKRQQKQAIAFSHGNIASVYNSLNRFEEAIPIFEKSIEEFKELGDTFMVGGYLRELAVSFIELGQLDKARETLELVLAQGIPINERFQTHTAYMLLARLEKDAGNFDAAEKMLMCSLENSDIITSDKLKYQSLLALSDLAQQRGEVGSALNYYRQYHETFTELNRSEFQERVRGRDFEQRLEREKQEAELAQKSLQHIETISQIGQQITATLSVNQIVQAVFDNIGTLMEVEKFAFGLCSDPAPPIEFKVLPETREYTFFQKKYLVRLSQVLHWCLVNRMPLVIQDFDKQSVQHEVSSSKSGKAQKLKGSMLCSPIVGAEKLLGVLVVQTQLKNSYTPANLEALKALSAYSAIAILNTQHVDELKEKNIQLERLASTDSLTGLYNRTTFTRNLTHEILRVKRYAGKMSTGFSFAFVDLDNFKYYNDNFGHEIGDLVLVAASKIIGQGIRSIDVIARFGGDEFMLLLPETPAEMCLVVADRIQKTLQQQKGFTDIIADAEGQSVTIHPDDWLNCSIGICEFMPEDVDSIKPNDILLRADLAMYAAKRKGRGCTTVWSPDLKRD